jgi:RNA recognition motif-containing protein
MITGNNVYIAGIPSSITYDELRKLFSSYGAIKDIKIIRDNMTGKCRGFAYVLYEKISEA